MVLLYVINNLGQGVPGHACFASTVQSMRQDAMRSLVTGQWQVNRLKNQPRLQRLLIRKQLEKMEDQIMPLLLEQQERQLTALLFQQASLGLFIDKLSTEKVDTLQKQLKNEDGLLRLLVVSAVGRRHLHLEKDLIERLSDPHPAVQEAAHKALVRVAHGTDFGPTRGTSQKNVTRSIEKWREWLTLQESASAEKRSKAAGKPTKVPPLEIVPLILTPEEPRRSRSDDPPSEREGTSPR